MKKFKFLMLSALFTAVIFTSCKKDNDDPKINEAQVLAEYLEIGDYANTYMPAIMLASEVKTLNATNQVYIIDIRSADDFNAGHILNAHNVTLANIVTHIKGVDLSGYTKVAIVCYSGQTAGYATSVLRVLGYDKVFSMKWGMCSWNAHFANSWNNAIANGNAYASQFVSTSTAKGPQGELPELSTGETTGEKILESRTAKVLADGFGAAKISSATVFGDLDKYYIVNYWPANHYTDPGHIPGAMQYTPKESIALGTDLKTLPTDKTIVVYCYTGQTSANMAAYLRILGYDAKSLLFGCNGMIYDLLGTSGAGHQFSESAIFDYEYVE